MSERISLDERASLIRSATWASVTFGCCVGVAFTDSLFLSVLAGLFAVQALCHAIEAECERRLRMAHPAASTRPTHRAQSEEV